MKCGVNLYFSIIDVKVMFVEVDSTCLGIDNPVGFLSSSCLQVDQREQTNKYGMKGDFIYYYHHYW